MTVLEFGTAGGMAWRRPSGGFDPSASLGMTCQFGALLLLEYRLIMRYGDHREEQLTTNDSGKLNMGGVRAIKSIINVPPGKRTLNQSKYLAACLTALAHQPSRWYSYQDWGVGGPVTFLAERRIEFTPVPSPRPAGRSWYDGCGCNETHWRETV